MDISHSPYTPSQQHGGEWLQKLARHLDAGISQPLITDANLSACNRTETICQTVRHMPSCHRLSSKLHVALGLMSDGRLPVPGAAL